PAGRTRGDRGPRQAFDRWTVLAGRSLPERQLSHSRSRFDARARLFLSFARDSGSGAHRTRIARTESSRPLASDGAPPPRPSLEPGQTSGKTRIQQGKIARPRA